MTCEECLVMIAVREEGPLEPAPLRELEAHLDQCDACQEVALSATMTAQASEVDRPDEPELEPLPTIDPGHYDWHEPLGRGGMGRVTRVRDRRLGRSVAIKELLSESLEQRFAQEARLTAQLQHPGIVTVHEAGRWPSGAPFYAMSLIEGRSLDAEIADRETLEQRLALVAHVADAVDALAYAHSRRVVHRDIKPHNIMVGPFGQTVVLDWGLAKNLSEVPRNGETASSYRDAADQLTAAGVGTPQYMAPEQARGSAYDERVDVYALGATLYHVLTGDPPYPRLPPLEVLALVKRGSPPTLHDAALPLPRDLCAIVDKAMARDPDARYPTALEMAADLKRYQTGQLVRACRYSPTARALRWARRHRAPVSVAAVAAVALAAVGTVATIRSQRERERTERSEQYARELETATGSAGAALLRHEGAETPVRVWTYMGSERPAVAIASPPDPEGTLSVVLTGHTDAVWAGAFHPSGQQLVTGSWDGTVRQWRASDGEEIGRLSLGRRVWKAWYAGDGAVIAAVAQNDPRKSTNRDRPTLSTWSSSDLHPILSIELSSAISGVSGDGSAALTVGDGSAVVRRVTDGQELCRIADASAAWFVSDSAAVFSRAEDGTQRLSTATCQPLGPWSIDDCYPIDVDTSSRLAVARCADGERIDLVDLDSGKVRYTVADGGRDIHDARFSDDSADLVAISKTVDSWDLLVIDGETGRVKTRAASNASHASYMLASSPDGQTVLRPTRYPFSGYQSLHVDGPYSAELRRVAYPIGPIATAPQRLDDLSAAAAGAE